jgi:hypothetical protein
LHFRPQFVRPGVRADEAADQGFQEGGVIILWVASLLFLSERTRNLSFGLGGLGVVSQAPTSLSPFLLVSCATSS